MVLQLALASWRSSQTDPGTYSAKRRQDGVYDLLREYIDGEKPLPRNVKQLVKHHNCYAAYVLEKTVMRIESARLKEPKVSEDTEQYESAHRSARSTTPVCDPMHVHHMPGSEKNWLLIAGGMKPSTN